MDIKGLILWVGFAVICAVIYLVSRRMKNQIEENGIETTGVISRIEDVGATEKSHYIIAFGFACAFVLLYGYNRNHMTNHFLSDVCFGTLITYLIYAAVSTAFLRSAKKPTPQADRVTKR